MFKIAFIGPEHNIKGLEAAGITSLPAKNSAEAERLLDKVKSDGEYKLVFITEELAEDLQEKISALNQEPGFCLTIIPDNRGTTGLIGKRMNELVKKAIGTEVFLK